MLHSAKAVTRELERLRRPSADFDASRYFRGADDLGFYNCGTAAMRALARSIYDANRERWTIDAAMRLADTLITDRHLEAKSVGIELVARYRSAFTAKLLGRWKRWLSGNHAANWATTDAICGALIGPLLVDRPELAPQMRSWAKHRSLWVRRASIVGLIRLARSGRGLDLVYEIAGRLHADSEDLIQKAVGWTLREAGKADQRRLESYVRAAGPLIPRTTLRYAIERFPPATRRRLLVTTRRGPDRAPRTSSIAKRERYGN
jgi:3-methyladenine DNA glycosylase AlkD